MSAVKGGRNSPRPIYSQLTVQADQKDLIVNQLKQQVFYLKKNESQFYKLQDQYKVLEYKYRALMEQKKIVDIDFGQRHQMAVRNICALRNQLDALKADLRDRCLQKDDLQTDSGTLKAQIDQRLIQIQKLRGQLNCLFADSDELQGEREKLQFNVNGLRQDQQSLFGKVKVLQKDIDSILRKSQELDKYQKKLSAEQNIFKQKILILQEENNKMDENINKVIDDLHNIDHNIQNSLSQLKTLQTDIAQINATCDKFKSQAIHYHKCHQSQTIKNNELGKVLNQALNTVKVRTSQIQQGRNQIKSLKNQNNEVQEINTRLQDDIQHCRRHLQNLALLNNDLVSHLQKFSQDDDIVRNMIDRKQKVARARVIVSQAVQYNKSLSKLDDTKTNYENNINLINTNCEFSNLYNNSTFNNMNNSIHFGNKNGLTNISRYQNFENNQYDYDKYDKKSFKGNTNRNTNYQQGYQFQKSDRKSRFIRQ